MNAALSDFSTMSCDMFLAVAENWGTQFTYLSRGVTSILIWGIVARGSSRMVPVLGTRSRETSNTFWTCIQGSGATLFPPAAGIFEDDTITDDQGIVYSIRVDDPNDLNSVFKMTAVYTQVKQVGAVGQ